MDRRSGRQPPSGSGQPSQRPGNPTVAQTLRLQGLDYGFNLDYRQALDAFQRAAAADPQDLTALRLAAATLWMQLLFEQGAVTVEDYLGQAQASVARPTPSWTMLAWRLVL